MFLVVFLTAMNSDSELSDGKVWGSNEDEFRYGLSKE